MRVFPVAIPTLNRYLHFRNCVESLRRCNLADKTQLIISLDYPPSEKYREGYKKIKEYISTINGFYDVQLIEHKYNLGAAKNWEFITNYCLQSNDAFIATEDDNVFSRCFLEYMNKALNRYQNDNKIQSISGYVHVPFYFQGQHNTFLSKDSCSWGFAIWRKKYERLSVFLNNKDYFRSVVFTYSMAEKIISTYPALYDMLCNMVTQDADWFDVKLATINILEGTYQLVPSVSLVRNEGFDGSGDHCGFDNGEFTRQEISTATTFELDEVVGLADTPKNIKSLYYQCLPREDTSDAIEAIKLRMKLNTIPVYRYYLRIKNIIYRIIRK